MAAFLTSWDAERRFWSDAVDNQGRKPMDVAQNEHTRRALVVRHHATMLQTQ